MTQELSPPRPAVRLRRAALALAVALAAGPGAAQAQLLGGGLPSVPGLPSGAVGGLPVLRDAPLPRRVVPLVSEFARAPLDQVRRLRAEQLLRAHADVVEADAQGQPVVRGQILAIAPDAAALAKARAAGFEVLSRDDLGGLGLATAVLAPPRGLSAAEALRRLQALDPQGRYDLNHLYLEGGLATAGAVAAAGVRGASGGRVGLVDGGVGGRPARGVRLVQRAFAPGGAKATAHATAVASLIAGPGTSLYVADVYGPTPTGGSAEAIAHGLAWLAENRVPVINVSLVGPPNRLLGAAVEALVARGHLVVAAVGNDGPAAPPLYPASYPGVVAVTGVDARRRVLPEAGRGSHVDFAAPGSDMAAAGLDGGFVSVRGTSFAAPVAARKLAQLIAAPDRVAAAKAVATLARDAVDLGAAGPDPVFGHGLVGFELRADPAAVGARGAVRGR